MRALAGIALGGGLPLVYSILGDLVETSRRTEASGIIGMAVGFGQGLGQVWIETSARVSQFSAPPLHKDPATTHPKAFCRRMLYPTLQQPKLSKQNGGLC